MAIYVYVDNSNVFIEGKRVSAVKKKLASNIKDAMNNGTLDNSWRLDFGRLHNCISVQLEDNIEKAVLFGSRPPENDSVWKTAKSHGFQTVIMDRNIANKEKKVDSSIITEMMKDAYKVIDKDEDTIVLVAGDGDFVPTIESLRDDGFDVKVFFWGHGSGELAKVGDFVNLDTHLDNLGYR